MNTPARFVGRVVKWTERGFGFLRFIDPASGRERDIYAHVSQIRHVIGFERVALHPEMEVTFAIIDGPKGPIAADVAITNLQVRR